RLGLLLTSKRRTAVARSGPLPVGEGAVHVRPPRPHANLDPGLGPNRTFEIRFLRSPASLAAGKGPQSTEQLATGPPDNEDAVIGGHETEDDGDDGRGPGPRGTGQVLLLPGGGRQAKPPAGNGGMR